LWIGTDKIGTSNKYFANSVSRASKSSDKIPTEFAVVSFVDAGFVADKSLTISNESKGISIEYKDGDNNLTKISAAKIDSDSVDGVHIDNTGAANDEIVLFSSLTGMKTSNRKPTSSVVADSNLPDGQAIINYFDSRVKFGTGTFNSSAGRTIPHGLIGAPVSVQITPTSNPNGYLGEYWVTWDNTNIYVYCSGSTTSTTFSWVANKS